MFFRPVLKSTSPHINRVLNSPTLGFNLPAEALIIGAGGRLGQLTVPKVAKSGLIVYSSERSISQATEKELDEAFKYRNFKVIINCAVTSTGSYEDMKEVNLDMPLRVSNAAKSHGIPVIQTSTTATQIDEIGENAPYALSKKRAEEALSELDNVTVCRLCALTGDKSDTINITHMAGAGGLFPLAIHFTGDKRTIQPISYNDASDALANLALALAFKQENELNLFPRVINFVGEPISISDFVRMLNGEARELHVNPEDLLEIAEIVQNGSLTPEFIHLARRTAGKQNTLCNTTFQSLLTNKRLTSPSELVSEIKALTHPLDTLKTGLKVFQGVSDKRGLMIATANFFMKRAFSSQE